MEVTKTKYSSEQLYEYLSTLKYELVKEKKKSKLEYLNISSSFDIETSSFYDVENKVGLMYLWTFGINSTQIFYGRKWDEFVELISILNSYLVLSKYKRLIVYVHNLDFEFQFMRKLFNWNKVFAIDTRKVAYALVDGIEFRCSYILSGYSVETLAKNLTSHKIKKLIGNLDYKQIRHSETPLTDEEMEYAYNDVLIVMYYIDELITQDGNVTKIPITNTGYVRKYVRDKCFYGFKRGLRKYTYIQYKELMDELTITDEEYLLFKEAFQGGFTHSNAFNEGKVLTDVASYDFTSAYPGVMITEMYPMSKGEQVVIKSLDELEKNISTYACIFEIAFNNIESNIMYEHYLSKSKCRNTVNLVEENGRVICADYLEITITELDFKIIKDCYSFDEVKIGTFYRYSKQYLPTNFVKAILKLYKDKTELKGVEGMEVEYLRSKGMLNSCYGMAVTDIIRDVNEYDTCTHEWNNISPNLTESIEKYNQNKNRFLSYAWGLYVTAYNRFNLFTAIHECGMDYVYSDTDSVKILNFSNHQEYFKRYNEENFNKLEKACKFHSISINDCTPKTIKGKIKTLGEWDFEGIYSKFKTLGAKRYMTESNGKISFTVSGVNKRSAIPYLKEKYKDNIWEVFDEHMYIPKGHTGKLTHTYIDEEREGFITDYKGNTIKYLERSATHLEECDFTMSMSISYLDYLLNIKEYEK